MTDSTGAAAQTSLPPHAQRLEIELGYWRSRAVTVAAELEFADYLADGPLHVDELARRTKTHAPSLYRLLRALETIGVFKQVTPRVFGNTPVSELLGRRATGSAWAITVDGIGVGRGELEAWTGLLGSVQTGEIGSPRSTAATSGNISSASRHARHFSTRQCVHTRCRCRRRSQPSLIGGNSR